MEDTRLVSHGSTKKDRKTKEFPRIEGTVFKNGIADRNESVRLVEVRGTEC